MNAFPAESTLKNIRSFRFKHFLGSFCRSVFRARMCDSRSMGRPWAALLLAAIPCSAADLPQAIDALMQAGPVARASVGIQVVDLKTGNALYSRNADRLFLPASNMKLFTAALALERLGPEYRLATRLVRATRVI